MATIDITLRQIRAFIHVAEAESFTRAAERAHLTQSTLTASVRELEKSLGLSLFDRTTRSVALTADGAEFLPVAVGLIQDFDAAVQSVRAVTDLKRGHVRIAAGMTIITTLLAPVVKAFSNNYPAVRVSIRDDNGFGVNRRVKSGEADIGVSGKYEDDPDLTFKPILKDMFGVVCRRDHPLATLDGPIAWRELSNHPYIGSSHDSTVHSMVAKVASQYAFFNSPAYEVSNLAGYESLLEEGLGFTILTALAASHNPAKTLVYRPLTGPAVHRDICIIARKGRSLSPAAAAMAKLLETRMRNAKLPRGVSLITSQKMRK
jgi:DNA-binding transcriptional LysR family regulator